MILSQAYAAEDQPAGKGGKSPRDNGQQRGGDETGVPGAIVATIFGLFGLLVVARRGLR